MGVVYLAEDMRLGRRVALKALAPEFARDPLRRKRFQQEARAAASITHPGIAAVYELEEVGEDLYIVYEYVRGESLRALVKSGGLDLDTLLDIATDIARALAAAHELGVVHRDLKPENIQRTPAGDTKILDFGLARFQPAALDDATRSVGLTEAGTILGTVAYMSPEQLESKEADFRSDIFSFGVLLYELAAGAHPFQGSSAASSIARIMTADPPPILQRNPIAPPELDRIVRKCLRKRREERYQSTRDLAVDLESLKRDSAERPASPAAGDAATAPLPAPALAAEHDSLLRTAVARVGFTPRRWWELHQLFVIFLYTPVALYAGLQGSALLSASLNIGLASTGSGWRDLMQAIRHESAGPVTIWKNAGLIIFVTLVLLLVSAAVTRLYALCLAAFVPARLPREIRRIHPALAVAYAIVACQLAFIGLLLLRSGVGLLWGVGLAAFGLVTSFAAVYVEPVMVRAAFPEVFARQESAEAQARSTKFRYIAGIHLAYLLLLLLPVAVGKIPLEDIFLMGDVPEITSARLGAILYGIILMVGGWALGVNAVESWRGNLGILRHFRQYFALYIFLDAVGIAAWIFAGHAPLPVAIIVAAILLFFPRVQSRLARDLLASSGEFPAQETGALAVPREFRLIAAIQALYLAPVVLFMGMTLRTLRTEQDEIVRGMLGAAGAEFLAWTALPVILFSIVLLLLVVIWRIAQGNLQWVRYLLRWFPLFLLFDVIGISIAMMLAMKYANIFVAWAVLPVLAYLPFYQRQLARRLLDRP